MTPLGVIAGMGGDEAAFILRLRCRYAQDEREGWAFILRLHRVTLRTNGWGVARERDEIRSS